MSNSTKEEKDRLSVDQIAYSPLIFYLLPPKYMPHRLQRRILSWPGFTFQTAGSSTCPLTKYKGIKDPLSIHFSFGLVGNVVCLWK